MAVSTNGYRYIIMFYEKCCKYYKILGADVFDTQSTPELVIHASEADLDKLVSQCKEAIGSNGTTHVDTLAEKEDFKFVSYVPVTPKALEIFAQKFAAATAPPLHESRSM